MERARALAAELADDGVGAIVVTPFVRTQQTAEPVARARSLTPRVVEVQGGQHHTLARTQVRMHCIPFTFSHLPPLRPQSRSSLCNARMRVDIRRSRQSVQ